MSRAEIGPEELAARIHGYLTRTAGPYAVPKYNLLKGGLWKIYWPDSQAVSIFKGRFIDVIALVVCDKRYFGDWIGESVEQVTNCNNGKIVKYEDPVPVKAPRVEASIIKRAQGEFLVKYI